MKNNLKKLLVLLLAANMFAGATLPTFAEEVLPENGTEVVENEDGTKKEITTTVTEETDEEGNTTITVKIEETIDETIANELLRERLNASSFHAGNEIILQTLKREIGL